MTEKGRYESRGVSSRKEDVEAAISSTDRGIFPTAFAKIVEDRLTGDRDCCLVFHSDGAGTKSSLAYVYHHETGDAAVFRGIAQDAIVMNTDDLLCVGATDGLVVSTIIDRNRNRVGREVIAAVIDGVEDFIGTLRKHGIGILSSGGETADVGDLVRTITVNANIAARMRRSDVITNDRIQAGDCIIGLSSSGRASYEVEENSGIGSNGLTSARHDLLVKEYATRYPESFDPEMPPALVYSGPYRLGDPLPGTGLTVGKALLSPTRTYLPVMREVLARHRKEIHGLVHATGGGQTKCLRFGRSIHYVKDNPFPVPPVFRAIQKASEAGWKELYGVFNMGHRLEVIVDRRLADEVVRIAGDLSVDARIVGHCEATSGPNRLTVRSEQGVFTWVR